LWFVLVVFAQPKIQTKNQAKNDYNGNDNEQCVPFELPCSPRRLDAFVQLLVGLLVVLEQLLEQLRQLDHRLLNALDVVVTRPNGTEDAVRLARAAAFELCLVLAMTQYCVRKVTYSLLENAIISPIGVRCFLNLRLSGLWVDNLVLSGDRFTVTLRVV
jgi:hypothetical protein